MPTHTSDGGMTSAAFSPAPLPLPSAPTAPAPPRSGAFARLTYRVGPGPVPRCDSPAGRIPLATANVVQSEAYGARGVRKALGRFAACMTAQTCTSFGSKRAPAVGCYQMARSSSDHGPGLCQQTCKPTCAHRGNVELDPCAHSPTGMLPRIPHARRAL